MRCAAPARGTTFAHLSLLLTTLLLGVILVGTSADAEPPLALCGNPGPAPTRIEHVVVVMMENQSYKNVVGSANAPYQTSLASQCGNPQAFFATTHTSAANYLATSAGQFPPTSAAGCGTISHCANGYDTIYNQLERAGLSWAGYMESMPYNCALASSGPVANGHSLYSLGHNPMVFFTSITAASCAANNIAVSDLTAQAGPFWDALQNQTLPSFSFVTPNAANNNQGGTSKAEGQQIGDSFVQKLVANVQQSNSYQAGDTLVLLTYDEGIGPDAVKAQDCMDTTRSLPVIDHVSAYQDSCHIPTFVLYPYAKAGDEDPAFFSHYSITKTVEDLFGLPYLAHAGDGQTNTLVGHFGIPAPPTPLPRPVVTISSPTAGTTVTGAISVAGTATSTSPISTVEVAVDGGPLQTALGTENWTHDLDTTTLTNGAHTISVKATDSSGSTSSTSIEVNVSNAGSIPLRPIVTIASPTASTSLAGTISVVGTATSANPISTVEVAVDSGPLQTALGTENWTHDLDTTTLTDGAHTISVKATDVTGETGTASIDVTVLNGGPIQVPPTVSITSPTVGAVLAGPTTVTGTATSGNPISIVEVAVDGGPLQTAQGTESWARALDTTTLSNGAHTISVKATDVTGETGTASVGVTVSNLAPASSCPSGVVGSVELSGNLSLEASKTGWSGYYNSNSVTSRVAVTGGSFDGSWALKVAPKAAGSAGANNASPVWVPGPPGASTTAGRSYTGTARMKPGFVGEKLSLLLKETTSLGKVVGTRTTTVSATDTSWRQLTTKYTALGSGNLIRYSVSSSNFTNTKQSFLADCLSLRTP